IKVIQVVQHQRFREHGELGRSEVVLPVVADDQVLDHRLEFFGENGQRCELGLQHLQFDNHVAEKLPLRGVRKRPVISQLVDLAKVVKKGAGEQQIPVDLGIISLDQVAGAE